MNLHMLSDCNDISRFYYAFAINSTLSQPINREVEIIPINLPRTDTHSITLPPDDYPDSPRGSFCQDETKYYATRKLYVNIQHHCEYNGDLTRCSIPYDLHKPVFGNRCEEKPNVCYPNALFTMKIPTNVVKTEQSFSRIWSCGAMDLTSATKSWDNDFRIDVMCGKMNGKIHNELLPDHKPNVVFDYGLRKWVPQSKIKNPHGGPRNLKPREKSINRRDLSV